jgi:ABC-type polar amino acid transport system, ATPase component
MNEKVIELVAVNKWYDKFHVLKDINLSVFAGEKVIICGPSGSGKSTLIRCVNRLEEHQEGSIVVRGVTLGHDTKILKKLEGMWGWYFSNLIYFLI